MKKITLKTLVMLNEIREHPAKIYIHNTQNDQEFEMDVSEYLGWKDCEIVDWTYSCGNSEYGDDDVITVWL